MKKTLFTLITLLILIFTNCADDDWKKMVQDLMGMGLRFPIQSVI